MSMRRLAVIMAADIVGFSTMMEREEGATLDASRPMRREVTDPKISDHKGRIIKTMLRTLTFDSHPSFVTPYA
jgi:adenylate cyclase